MLRDSHRMADGAAWKLLDGWWCCVSATTLTAHLEMPRNKMAWQIGRDRPGTLKEP